MKLSKEYLLIGLSLIASSGLLYFGHYLLFQNKHYIIQEHFLGDLAFIPIEVLIVTLIIHKFIEDHEKKIKMQKLNMIIGVFFSEIGFFILNNFSSVDKNAHIIRKSWDIKHLKRIQKDLTSYEHKLETDRIDLEVLAKRLNEKREFLIKLLENPILFEHETFTTLLRAMFHLEEEFSMRLNIHQLTDLDKEHIKEDLERVYKLIIKEWVVYLEHLQDHYPYLFGFAISKNPFNQASSPKK